MNEAQRQLNQKLLALEMQRVAGFLETPAREMANSPQDQAELAAIESDIVTLRDELDAADPLTLLRDRFGLSSFECSILLLCAATNLNSEFAALVDERQSGKGITFALALETQPEANWSATLPSSPLRHWRFVRLAEGPPLMQRSLQIEERLLHFLMGNSYLHEQLASFQQLLPPRLFVSAAQADMAELLLSSWNSQENDGFPIIELVTSDSSLALPITFVMAQLAELELVSLKLPTAPIVSDLARVWEREARLQGALLFIQLDRSITDEQLAFLQTIESPLVVGVETAIDWGHRPVHSQPIAPLSRSEQAELWHHALGLETTTLNGMIEQVVTQFQLSAGSITEIAAIVLAELPALPMNGRHSDELAQKIWELCRGQSTPLADALIQPIETLAHPDELVLPEKQHQLLDALCLTVRNRATVYEQWGFARKSARGLGISALFSGPSGTGKTMAAEILAQKLNLDLYRVDLSQVINKYIGETEKNLARVFAAAEASGAILLFDEADALFGKRTEVHDSHDRYANVEVSYLLQRVEAYRGLVILTSNLPENLDSAFLRRLRFIIRFPFPDEAARKKIWQTVLPEEMPRHELDLAKLAQLNISGGTIRNIAMQAAVFAAQGKEAVQMAHLYQAAKNEYAKLDRALTGAETRGWM